MDPPGYAMVTDNSPLKFHSDISNLANTYDMDRGILFCPKHRKLK